MTTATEYRVLTTAEAAAFLDSAGIPHGLPTPRNGINWTATIRPLDAWRVLQDGTRKPTPLSYLGVKGRVEKRHGELVLWEETGDGEAMIVFRLVKDGL